MKFSKTKSIRDTYLTIKSSDGAIYGFPKRLSKHLNKNDWSPYHDHINKAALQVIKNRIKGHEKNGDKNYLPFEIMITTIYEISGKLDRIHYPFVTIKENKK